MSAADVLTLNEANAVLLPESWTSTVKLAVPVAVGVPVTTPAEDTLRFSDARLLAPVAPAVTVHV
jgi:hypothetical protein